MKFLSRSLFIIGLIIGTTLNITAKDKVKFGKVSMKELTMTKYKYDTSAVAVVLYESGYYDGKTNSFYKHIRYKILKKAGLVFASNKYNTSAKSFIRGITYNLEEGKIVETRLENDNIFREKVWDHFFINDIAMPNVKVGSVLDIELKYDGFPSTWYFQRSIPVKYSELQLGDCPFLTFRKKIAGIISPENVGHNHWKVENMPAFVPEPYISSKYNYMSRIELDINETHFPRYYPLEYTTTWKSVQTLLYNNTDYFGKTLIWPNTFLNDYAKEINSIAKTEEHKAKLAVQKIKSIMDWDGRSRLFVSKKSLFDVSRKKEGSSADMNMMLIALLKKLNLEVYPMVMSNRADGFIPPVNPTLNKLNYVVAYVRINGEFEVLDATSKKIAWNMLPNRCLNYSGQVLDDRDTFRAEIKPKEKAIKKVYYNLKLDGDLKLHGLLSYMNKGYSAYEFRRKYAKYIGVEDFIDNVIDENEGLNITDYKIENIENLSEAVTQKYDVEIEDAIKLIDDHIYLNMFFFEKMNENPFKSEERFYPVDLTYSRFTNGVVRLQIPENCSVEELPTPVSIVMPGGSGKFTMMYNTTGNIIVLNYKLQLNDFVFPEDSYKLIKELYAQIVINESKDIILKIN